MLYVFGRLGWWGEDGQSLTCVWLLEGGRVTLNVYGKLRSGVWRADLAIWDVHRRVGILFGQGCLH